MIVFVLPRPVEVFLPPYSWSPALTNIDLTVGQILDDVDVVHFVFYPV